MSDDPAYAVLSRKAEGVTNHCASLLPEVRVPALQSAYAALNTHVAPVLDLYHVDVRLRHRMATLVPDGYEPPDPDPGEPATGATAGTPGEWTPEGSVAPTLAGLLDGYPVWVEPDPTDAWASGEHVICADGQPAYWHGNKWRSGVA